MAGRPGPHRRLTARGESQGLMSGPGLAKTIEALYDVATQQVSGLTLSEIRSAMTHPNVSEGDLSLAARIVLHMMQCF